MQIYKQPSPTGITFLPALTLIFITLKLCGVIAWSWWFVLCPMWLPLAMLMSMFAIAVLFAAWIESRKAFTLHGGKYDA